MRIRPNDLSRTLERGLAGIYLIAGDETLIVEESCDAIIARARREGFSERTIVIGDATFDWHQLRNAAASLSLFAARRVIDLRLLAKKFDKDAASAIGDYLERATGDTLVLLRTGQLAKKQRESAWLSRIDAAGVVMLVWPVKVDELPRWMAARCRGGGIELDREALELLCERVEGNLLAAAQEIEKLRILDLPQPISVDALRAAVMDASHFDGFDLVDAALAGDAPRVRRALYVLREEGEAPLVLLSVLAASLRRLFTGDKYGLTEQRVRSLDSARRRLAITDLEAGLVLAETVDRQVKGVALGDPWQTIERLALGISGTRIPL